MNKSITNYKTLTQVDLLNSYNESLREYEHWVNNNYALNRGWDEEVFYDISIRDELHNIVTEARQRTIDINFTDLIRLDKKWQEWLLGHTEPGYGLKVRRDDQPKSNWWWWVDKLSELSGEEKSTL